MWVRLNKRRRAGRLFNAEDRKGNRFETAASPDLRVGVNMAAVQMRKTAGV